MTPPLAGVRVVELGHVMAGPVCGLMLADLGAEVVKVERLPDGDATRGFAPPTVNGESAAFMMLNRGKRGVALDLQGNAGRKAFLRIVGNSDVLIENFRPGTMERMGYGWEELSARWPRLVYCQISGFGRTGPLAPLGGFDLIAQGYAGLMSITGEGSGRPPVKVGGPVTDITAGALAALGAVSALFQRRETGRGRRVDTSLFEAGIIHTYWQSAIALGGDSAPGPLGSAHPLTAPYQAFRSSDGWINIGASNQKTWRRLVETLGVPELAEDRRFKTNERRMENLEELIDLLSPIVRERSSEHWLGALATVGVPAGLVATIPEMLANEQTETRMLVETEHSVAGRVKGIGCPVKFSGADEGRTRRPAPRLGEHTREVLAEVGMTEAEIDEVVGQSATKRARAPRAL